MILDKLSNCSCYAGLSPAFAAAFHFLKMVDLNTLPVGRYHISGDDVYLLIQEAGLKPREQGIWEAHKLYADIQLVIHGEEFLGFGNTQEMDILQPYDAKRDIVIFKPKIDGLMLPVADGDFVILFPQDAHCPCLCREQENACMKSRRAVVKVRL